MKQHITPAELKSLLASDATIVVLDVRRRGAYDADRSAIPGASWRDPEDIAHWSAMLPKDKEIVVYCVHGQSVSHAVIDDLRKKGFAARYLEGGIEAWKQGGGATTEKS